MKSSNKLNQEQSDLSREIIKISSKFCGPPGVANGGYTCGILAGMSTHPTETVLKKPIPLSRQVIRQTQGGVTTILYKQEILAQSRVATLELEIPDPPSFEEAEMASKNYLGFKHNPFPKCFVCGHKANPKYALSLFAGKVRHRDVYATPFIPKSIFSDTGQHILPEFIWSALDCPGAFAIMQEEPKIIVLGTMNGQVMQPICSGSKYVVTSWLIESVGRKHFCGTAIFDARGQLHARARSVWIEVKKEPWAAEINVE